MEEEANRLSTADDKRKEREKKKCTNAQKGRRRNKDLETVRYGGWKGLCECRTEGEEIRERGDEEGRVIKER